jgi:hypothetical protein
MSPKKRRRGSRTCKCPTCQQHSNSLTAEVHRAINRFLPATDERSRRLLAGSLAREHGRGGIALVARITGLSPHTIRRGRRELEHPPPTRRGRIRRKGAGPKPIEKKVPGS